MATSTYGTPYVQGSDLVSAYPTVSSSLATRVDEVSYKGNGLNAQTGTTYTLVAGDAGKTITLSNASPVAVTLPQDSTADLPDGAVVAFYNLGAGVVTISQGTGATLQGGSITLAQYQVTSVIKLSANTYGKFDGAPASGLNLMSPTSIANSGGSASASGGTVTFSTVTSLSLNGVFTSAYENYEIIFSNASSASGSVVIYWRLRAAGTDATGSNYNFQRQSAESATGYLSYSSGQAQFSSPQINATAEQNYITARFLQPQLARRTMIDTRGGYHGILENYYGGHTLQTSYDGFTVYPSSSTMTGTIRVYGFQKD